MTKDQLLTRLLTRRRALLAGAAAVGAVGTARLLVTGGGDEPVRHAATSAAGPRPQATRALKPSAYRLQPLT
jgi:peptidoglycan-N-acetylglucosamine deacetylase